MASRPGIGTGMLQQAILEHGINQSPLHMLLNWCSYVNMTHTEDDLDDSLCLIHPAGGGDTELVSVQKMSAMT